MPGAGDLLRRRRLRRGARVLVPQGADHAADHAAQALSTEAARRLPAGVEGAMIAARRNLLRRRSGHEHGRVTYVELFFDLVFVFAVTQLSHGLLEHLTL